MLRAQDQQLAIVRKETIQVTTYSKRAVKSSRTGPGFSGLHHIYKKNICLYFNLVSPTQICLKLQISQMTECDCDKEAVERET